MPTPPAKLWSGPKKSRGAMQGHGALVPCGSTLNRYTALPYYSMAVHKKNLRLEREARERAENEARLARNAELRPEMEQVLAS